MIRKYLKLTLFSALALYLPSCGHDQQLVSIEILPSSETFLTPDSERMFNLEHLARTSILPSPKILPIKLLWSSNTPQVAVVSPREYCPQQYSAVAAEALHFRDIHNKPQRRKF